MNKTLTELNWHVVCGEMEVEELLLSGVIKYKRFNPRHDMFFKIKNPTVAVYTGGWGPEPLLVESLGEYIGTVGRIHCSYRRYTEIAEWFLNQMFRQ